MMQKRFTLLFGLLLVSGLPGAAQKPDVSLVPKQEHSALVATRFRETPTRWPTAATPKPEGGARFPLHSLVVLTPASEGDINLAQLVHAQKVETLFVEHWHLPVGQFWGGRLQLDGFESDFHLDNAVLGPSASGGLHDFRPARRSQPGMPYGMDLYGIRLGFQFGRHPQPGPRPVGWRSLIKTLTALIADATG